MNIKLKKLFDQLEAEKDKLLDRLQGIDPDRLNYNASADTWSVNQILSHIITAEVLSLQYMEKKSLGIAALDDSGFREVLKIKILIISQRFPFKFKAPKFVVQHTPKSTSLPDIITQWNTHRQALKRFLETMEDKNVYKKIYKHPRAGMLNTIQALVFFREHHIHHLPQINRLITYPLIVNR